MRNAGRWIYVVDRDTGGLDHINTTNKYNHDQRLSTIIYTKTPVQSYTLHLRATQPDKPGPL